MPIQEFKIKRLWFEEINKKVKSFKKTIYLGIPFYLLFNLVFSYSLTTNVGVAFWLTFFLTSILTTTLCTYLPLAAIKRYNSIVEEIVIDDVPTALILTFNDERIVKCSSFRMSKGTFRLGNKNVDSILINDELTKDTYFLLTEAYDDLPDGLLASKEYP